MCIEMSVSEMQVTDFLEAFTGVLRDQLDEDRVRWGDTWLKRKPDGQELRTRATFDNYFDKFEYGDEPIPWLKVAGEAMICWIRDNYPEYWSEEYEND